MNKKVNCVDIEIAIMDEMNYRQNLIVPNVTNQMMIVPFETDVLVLTKSGYAYGFEIKVSKADLRADFKKKHHTKLNEFHNGKSGFERYYGKFKHFYYAVPESLKEDALAMIPEFCGLWVYDKGEYPVLPKFYKEREAKKLFDYKWTEKEKNYLARLGTMRIYTLKNVIKYHLSK